ncbi:MAG: hypothetical protein M2R45_01345 [Verrucomicrobia subdivision 3 bacterium]|nr:hypothetical protein [Limisphaerales bacterium]MCS1416036.1 hypothetical protein [Limisphaerales bacterium]
MGVESYSDQPKKLTLILIRLSLSKTAASLGFQGYSAVFSELIHLVKPQAQFNS